MPPISTPTHHRAIVLALLASRSYRHGRFTLASGRSSDHYINCKPVSLSGSGLASLSALLLEQVEPDAAAVAGLTLGADPLVSGVAMAAALAGRNLDALIVRKEAKGHGTGAWLEGPLPRRQPDHRAGRRGHQRRLFAQGGAAVAPGRLPDRAGGHDRRPPGGGLETLAAEGLELRSIYLLEEIAAAARGLQG